MSDIVVEQSVPAVPAAKLAKCEKCGAEFTQSTGRGRPRKFCPACRPPRAKPAKQE